MSLDQNEEGLIGSNRNIHQHLIDACRRNERQAQFEIYKLYYKAMYNTALRIVNDPTEAEDIMQEAFLDAFRKIDNYGGIATFGAWMKRIVINKAINAYHGKKESVELNEEQHSISDEPEEKEDTLKILSYKVDKIREVMDKLPHNDRVVLSLYLLEGYDHEEIAQILRINHNAARTRYSRARQKLLSKLKSENVNHIV